MDRLTTIENELVNVLKDIDGSLTDTYQYLTDVKTVDVIDEVLEIDGGGYPSILVDLDPNEIIGDGESKAYRNTRFFKLTCRVSNEDVTVNPRQAIKTKMNMLDQDIKYALSSNYHLNDSCDSAYIISSNRIYHNENSILRTGDLIMNIKVVYTQSRLNPSLNVCN